DSTSVCSTALEVEGRAADDLEHFRRRRLLIEGFAQFAEQARVFDGDHCLVGEGLEQGQLLLCERAGFPPVNYDRPDSSSIPEQGHTEQTAKPPVHHMSFVLLVSKHVRDLDRSTCEDRSTRYMPTVRRHRVLALEHGHLGLVEIVMSS